jgi:chemotaxis protein histidine kinase CheA
MLEEKEILFNKNKAQLKAELTERAAKAKQLRADAETEAKDYEAQKEEKEKQLADIKEKINTAFAQKQKLEKMTLPTLDEMLADTSDYQRLIANKAEEEKKLDSVALTQEDNTKLSDLEAKKVQYADELQRLNTQLATKTQYERIQKLITAINEEKQSLVEQLSELERKEDIACQYQDRQNAILEERVNQHFSIVRWKMFRTVNNGGDSFQEPYCECLVDGIPYGGGLNQAARLNAGLDVINTMCRHYNVSAPIVIDNSESTLNIIPTTGQQIRLQVADKDLQTL